MTAPAKEMHAFSARLDTFQTPHQLNKRRASAQAKKKGGNTVEWPHEKPTPEALARAGFFYKPSSDSSDNVQCFMCTVKLDGWESTDDPVQEHLAHTRYCPWAISISVTRHDGDGREAETRDPMADEILDARKATFTTGDGWPHEGKKGWKCKVTKMLEAGWTWDPACEGEEGDGVTCFYCNLSLDGWEPKDDPFEEHKRRSPSCRFFELLEYYHGVDAAHGKMKRTKGRGKAAGRASSASKTSRVSTQSAMSVALSTAESLDNVLGEAVMTNTDDSILTSATDNSRATTTSTTKAKKKGTRSKVSAKGAKGKKKAMIGSAAEDEMELQFADASQSQATQESFTQPSQAPIDEEQPPLPAKSSKRGTRASKQIDSSVIEISHIEAAPVKKATRTRKAKAEPQPESQSMLPPETPDAGAIAQTRLSEVSAQLQHELDHSVDELELPMDESTPVAQPTKPKRGVKRSSDGLKKSSQTQSNVDPVEVTAPIKGKGKRGRPKKASSTSILAQSSDNVPAFPVAAGEDSDILNLPPVEAAQPPKKAKGRTTKKKNSSSRTSRSSKATITASEPEPLEDEPEDLARDELEIEKELERIAAEQSAHPAIQSEQDREQEFEGSPSQGHTSRKSAEFRQLHQEIETEDQGVEKKDFASPPRRSKIPGGFSPSPSGSDKENQPSSQVQVFSKQADPAVVLSPTKTIRIPLATNTPNRSPAKGLSSPSKQISHLSSTAPWAPIDLDHVLLLSPQPSPGTLGQQLVAAAGGLTSPEKKMSVEDWVRHRAEKSEEDLRRRCEQMVATFEKEGMRGLESLNGINVVG